MDAGGISGPRKPLPGIRLRAHLALEKDAPDPRAVHNRGLGEVIAFPEVGGLHHRYERRAA